MNPLFHVSIRSEQDGEVIEFDSTQPVLHIDMPAGRFLITVRCAGQAPEGTAQKGSVH
ncbi:MAG TPA: hypothetical protein VHG88_06665 [Burkholderiales bacterium]|nr:hypothetical protein [Burkholderiales bacterium]